jgi:leucine dehydrogenase
MKYLNNLRHFTEYDNHESVYKIEDKDIGLYAYIAIHNTNLGPATGGTRFFSYSSREEAIADVLRLSKAMTYKCALARVPYGGGKGVIIGNPKEIKTEILLKRYANAVNKLEGKFTTGEDVGLTQEDIMVLSGHSKYIHGRKGEAGELGSWAALGVFKAIQVALEFKFDSDSIKDRLFAIKGVGEVGLALCKLIDKHGGSIIVADTDIEALKIVSEHIDNIKIVDSSEIHKQIVDVYCPCALGNEFNEDNIQELNCKIICGAANNQLASRDVGEYFYKKGITYVPDYVANAGGLINIVSEMNVGGYDKTYVENKINVIANTTKQILELARKNKRSTSNTADVLAKEIINANK